MIIPSDPEQQKCGGIIDAARATGGDTGQKVVDLLSDMALAILGKSVINEETIIESGPITIYTKM